MGIFEDDGIEVLDEDQCLSLAASRPVGRVAVTVSALPAVFPVNFRLAGKEVLFHTSAGTKLDAATRGAVVAFEVDDFDTQAESGWSVLIVGLASVVSDVESMTIERLPPRPWASGSRHHLVRITGEFVSGRRVGRPFPRGAEL